MVLLKETGPEMFWGVSLDEGKKYTQTVESSFHMSMAALEPASQGGNQTVSIYLNHSGSDFLLCTLKQGTIFQQALDLGFMAGEMITLFTSGKGRVHLTGYRVFDEDDMDDDMMQDMDSSDLSEDISDDEQVQVGQGDRPANKRAASRKAISAGIEELNEEDLSDDDDDEDYDMDSDDENALNGLLDREALEGSSDEDDEEDSEDDDEEDDEEEDDEEDDEEEDEDMPSDSEIQAVAEQVKRKMVAEQTKQAKKQKLEQPKSQGTPSKQQPKTPQQQKTPKDKQGKTPQQQKTPQNQQKQQKTPQNQQKQQTPKNGKSKGESQTPKEQPKTPKGQQSKEAVKTPKPSTPATTPRRKLPSGIVVEELKAGHGPEAKSNKMVQVYYTGKLGTGKIFDSSTSGRPFKFRLGKNEVIKGWELGLQGMKVGGKRRLTIPPALAYGSTATGGIPANSTLHFDVELKNVS